ncbi:FAD/NAD(P)-binding protein [Actinoplanes sp. NPDC023714]|uniref:FAD/NAD(P)-binding protein n=1 Tax=Actinoplanes sp. NPDC023714 TaxID=3154322 RepID=UPI003406297C
MRPLRLAIVGGGPSATYVMERLAATAPTRPAGTPLVIDVFDLSGRFGDGQVHSAEQPVTSFLNRIVGQVSFAADPTVTDAGPLLDPALRPTLYEWCRLKFAETGDPVFDVTPESWPKRYVHGLALRESFSRYVELLRGAGVTVNLRHAEVTDVEKHDDAYRLRLSTGDPVAADHVLFLTGHSANDPRRFPRTRPLAEFADRHPVTFVSAAYPLERHLTDQVVTTETTVGCIGMGLTGIDVILHLTEGRGGRFADIGGGRLRYEPSGREPRSIAVFSEAGLLTFARPYNAKERDPQRLEHRGLFLTEETVDVLRDAVGTPCSVPGAGVRNQLDFEAHLLPVVLLEMGHLYYRTLLGPGFADHLEQRVRPAFERFAHGRDATYAREDPERLLAHVDAVVDTAQDLVDGVCTAKLSWAAAELGAAADGWQLEPALRQYLSVVFGADAAHEAIQRLRSARRPIDVVSGRLSPWRHAGRLRDNRFSWPATIDPLGTAEAGSAQEYRAALLDFIDRDHLFAAQGNVANPAKAAADGVWRDLRPVLAHAVDFGGLTAASHRRFLDIYLRHHNRLCNGAALEVMEKIRAVIECGLVDAAAGPRARVAADEASGRFRVHGPRTGADIPVDVLVDARVHAFDPERDTLPLYPNLLRRGIVRKWRNPAVDGPDFEPGGLDLDSRFHPVGADGRADPRLTFLGPPSEGVMFFQLGALRPNQDHHVMQDVLTWLGDFWRSAQSSADVRHAAAVASPA